MYIYYYYSRCTHNVLKAHVANMLVEVERDAFFWGLSGVESLGRGDKEESEYGSLVPTESPTNCIIDRAVAFTRYTIGASVYNRLYT